MLELIDVSKSYAGHTVLEPMSLHIGVGRIYAIIGPSGCGKSTLLRLMIGLITPDNGRVRFQGRDLVDGTLYEARRRMGYVIQDGGLFPHLTAEQNVTLMARHLGWSGPRIRERVAELTELARFPNELLERYPVQLSGGQRQRVSLMRALMLDPDLLLLDEPLGALDPLIRADLQDDLLTVFRTLGKTVVMVTHDIGEAAFFGDELVLMRSGQIVQRGTFDDIMRSPAEPFVTQFISAQRTPVEAVPRELP